RRINISDEPGACKRHRRAQVHHTIYNPGDTADSKNRVADGKYDNGADGGKAGKQSSAYAQVEIECHGNTPRSLRTAAARNWPNALSCSAQWAVGCEGKGVGAAAPAAS